MLSEIMQKITHSIPQRLQRRKEFFLRKYLQKRVLSRKKFLSDKREIYTNYKDITFVIQSFNKRENIKKVLIDLLNVQAMNIVLIDDGSIDGTLQSASHLLTGENHIILRSNDVHEVINYRRAILMSNTKYVCLMQDDDIPLDTPVWIDNSLEILELLAPQLIILGLREGFDFTWMSECVDEQEDTLFYSEEDLICLKNIYEATLINPKLVKLQDGRVINFNFCQVVNRAPTFIRREEFLGIGSIGIQFKPYQYDDIDYCLRAWMKGFKVGITSSNFLRDIGQGGMRLFNNVKPGSKPKHFTKNWSYIRCSYSTYVNTKLLQRKVVEARNDLVEQ
jgi:glycosyltransferase involved in cell wall biosynthesis